MPSVMESTEQNCESLDTLGGEENNNGNFPCFSSASVRGSVSRALRYPEERGKKERKKNALVV